MSETIDFEDPFIRGLACAVITPGLHSVLVFDASPETLQVAAATLTQMLAVVTGKEVEIVRLGTSETDDDLWGHLGLGEGRKESLSDDQITSNIRVIRRSGLLTKGQGSGETLLLFIPDLTRLSLAAVRATVVLMGADVAHLERFGQREQWQPHICWLAGCRQNQIGQISPHLLDRFALRLHGTPVTKPDRELAVLNWANEPGKAEIRQDPLPDVIKGRLAQVTGHWAVVTADAIQRVFAYDTGSGTENTRRQIALIRLAQALAQLDDAPELQAIHTDQAAQLIRLVFKEKPGALSLSTDTTPDTILHDQPVEPLLEQPMTGETRTELTSLNTFAETPVYESRQGPELLELVSLPVPYPEDTAVIERESASLRLPLLRYGVKSEARGPVIGLEPTTNLQDLALVGTLIAAAPYQTIRRQNKGTTDRAFLLSSSDLRRYRRLPVAEQMLVLLLDYTCLEGIDWQTSLLPHLRWAYTERASISIVQVGVAINPAMLVGAIHPDQLRAHQVLAPSLLDPRIETALSAAPGRATPLAHGLDLAYHLLRHALQHGRQAIQHALLLVLTDGRGNIPLTASQTGRIKLPVGRGGIEDALAIAQRIRGLRGVATRFLNPQPQLHPHLPLTLADALGATVELLPQLANSEGRHVA